MPEIRRDVETFVLGHVTYHAMSKGEVAEGGLTPEEKDGSVSPTKQGVPWGVRERWESAFTNVYRQEFKLLYLGKQWDVCRMERRK